MGRTVLFVPESQESRDRTGWRDPGSNNHDDSSGNLPPSSSSGCHLSPAQKTAGGAVLHPEIQGEDGQEEHAAATSTRPSKSHMWPQPDKSQRQAALLRGAHRGSHRCSGRETTKTHTRENTRATAEGHRQAEGPTGVGNGRVILNTSSNILIKSGRAPGRQNKHRLA